MVLYIETKAYKERDIVFGEAEWLVSEPHILPNSMTQVLNSEFFFLLDWFTVYSTGYDSLFCLYIRGGTIKLSS